MQSKVKSK